MIRRLIIQPDRNKKPKLATFIVAQLQQFVDSQGRSHSISGANLTLITVPKCSAPDGQSTYDREAFFGAGERIGLNRSTTTPGRPG